LWTVIAYLAILVLFFNCSSVLFARAVWTGYGFGFGFCLALTTCPHVPSEHPD
jgi:hypothetical protein